MRDHVCREMVGVFGRALGRYRAYVGHDILANKFTLDSLRSVVGRAKSGMTHAPITLYLEMVHATWSALTNLRNIF